MNILSLFDGISCGQIALEKAGIDVKIYFASEVDKYAIEITNKNYPTTIQIGDVRNIEKEQFPEIDLLIGGSPCQDLSISKAGDGLNGKHSNLFFEYVRLLREIKPKYFLFENVMPRKKSWKETMDYCLGTKGVLINSNIFVQQNRPRYYWTNIKINNTPLKPAWKGDYYQWRRTYYRKNKSGVCPCLMANMGTGGHNVPLKSENKQDKLTPLECERLQGLPDNYTEGVSNRQRYKLIGNAWTVPVVTNVFKRLR